MKKKNYLVRLFTFPAQKNVCIFDFEDEAQLLV